MAGESNQRTSWWKFKSKSQDHTNQDGDIPGDISNLGQLYINEHNNTNSLGKSIENNSSLDIGSSNNSHKSHKDDANINSNTERSLNHGHYKESKEAQDLTASQLQGNALREFRDQFLQSKNNTNGPSENSVFNVELEKSLEIAFAKISVSTDNPSEFFEYGKIPTVVAKCGMFLKHKGLDVEGIFRVGGSSKRVKQLQTIFCTPPDYGRKLDWTGYTVHDAASLLRRFLNSMPEPVIPLSQYEAFRAPLQKRPRILKYLAHRGVPTTKSKTTKSTVTANTNTPTTIPTTDPTISTTSNGDLTPSQSKKPVLPSRPTETFDTSNKTDKNHEQSDGLEADDSGINNGKLSKTGEEEQKELDEEQKKILNKKRIKRIKKHKRFVEDINGASKEYEILVQSLPEERKQLLLYILDLLDLFSQHSSENRMSSANLSAVFQPSILSHPKDDMSPDEYVLSQRAVEFLVEYSYKLLPQETNKISKKVVKKSKNLHQESNEAQILRQNVGDYQNAEDYYVKAPQKPELNSIATKN